MSDAQYHETNDNIRFFAKSSVFKKQQEVASHENDPTPFGLNFQEPFPVDSAGPAQNGSSMFQCPTSTMTGPDTGIDFDISV